MAQWKKFILSGSEAELANLSVDNNISASIFSGSQFSGSFSGSFFGDGSGLTGIPEGPQGPNGPTGPTGLQGPTGTTGPTGPVGPTGIEGVQGVQGVQGSQGLQGAQGVQGDLGPVGPQGVQGPQGAQGLQGAQGTEAADGSFGGATFDYTFDTSTSIQPASGEVRLDNTQQSGSTGMYINYSDDNGTSIKSFLQTVDSVTSTIKGHVRIANRTDATQFLLFQISEIDFYEDNLYADITIAAGDGSEVSPFTDAEDITVSFVTIFLNFNGIKTNSSIDLTSTIKSSL